MTQDNNEHQVSYTVTLAASGSTFDVEAGETVLEAALRQGMVLPYSCRTGSCSTCKGRIISGEVDLGNFQEQALSPRERAGGYALLCQASPRSDLKIEAREVAVDLDIEIRTLPCRVVGLTLLTHDVMGVQLKLPQNQRFSYLAGQYIDLLLRDGRRRSFSMASPPSDEGVLELHVRRVPGGFFTNYVFEAMKVKELLRLQGPFGTFFLRDDSKMPAVLVAGGTGLAPIKAILERAVVRQDQRPMRLYWGIRTSKDLYLQELLDRWVSDLPDFRYQVVVSEPDPEDPWTGPTGWVHEAVLSDYPDLSNLEVYASGPPPMIDAIREGFVHQGLSEDRLFFDSFEFAYDGIAEPIAG